MLFFFKEIINENLVIDFLGKYAWVVYDMTNLWFVNGSLFSGKINLEL